MIATKKVLALAAMGLIAALTIPAEAKLAANKLAANKLAANGISTVAGEGAVIDVFAIELPNGTRLER